MLVHEALGRAQAEAVVGRHVAGSKPTPSSTTSSTRRSASWRTVSDIRSARAWRATLRTDSWATRQSSATAGRGAPSAPLTSTSTVVPAATSGATRSSTAAASPAVWRSGG